MTSLVQFRTNIDAADQLVAMYFELREFRNVGARGRLDAANQNLLWLPRSAVVASLSALDAYVHKVINDRMPQLISSGTPLPDALCEQLAQMVPIKNGNTFRDALPLLSASDTMQELFTKFDEKVLRFQSYQAPDRVIEAYRLIGYDNVFKLVSALWPGPNTTDSDIKSRLLKYARRRNQIAHEGDIEINGSPRAMAPEYAIRCSGFIRNLVTRLNEVVYGP